ncbi:Tet(A)/Tet(B)/Tet(C) family tetracycline efflux MFS transporter [Singulisphaera sp. Ch08]|uniref:Tet(A)/Tet(B)/Tet(C) family tetracycline efflux MFS transporter n=1 Tax=Singulisphaera sp. Ch08 TaxID=3120278 RepID=A0AAU7CI28_9BACT
MNRPLIVILVTVTLDSVGIGLVTPVIPSLLRELTHDSQIAGRYGYFLALYSLMQFLFSPILGSLSDRFGRRPVLLVSLAGAAIDYTVMALTPFLSILYLGRMVAGVTGANMAVATAYIADISREDERAKRFGYMNACFGLGFVAGPLIGGLVGTFSPRYPFLVAALFNGLNFLLGYFVLPESRSTEASRAEKSAMNPIQSLRWVWGVKVLLPFLVIYFVIHLVGQVPGTIWVIYGEDKFGWDSRIIGLSLAAFGILHAVSQAFLTGPITKLLGERGSIILGLLSDGSAYVLMAFATRGWMAFATMPLFTTGGIAMPALQSLISNQVNEDKQGELQGTLVSLMSLAAVFGPIAVTELYAAYSDSWTGIVWVAGATLYLFCIPALWRKRQPTSRELAAPV